MDLPGYDEWKLRTPPEYEGPECERCGEPMPRWPYYYRCADCEADLASQEEVAHREPTEAQQGLIPIPDGYAEQ